jgi:hypothetical protein
MCRPVIYVTAHSTYIVMAGHCKRVLLQLHSNLVGLRLFQHSHMLGLLGPGIAHHRLDHGLGLAYQRLVGLGLDHQGLDPGI